MALCLVHAPLDVIWFGLSCWTFFQKAVYMVSPHKTDCAATLFYQQRFVSKANSAPSAVLFLGLELLQHRKVLFIDGIHGIV